MKRFIALLIATGIALSISAEEIFKTKWQGMDVQEFTSTDLINSFTVSGPDGSGYIYLKALSATGSGEIIRTRWQGTGVQDFSPGAVITGFQTSGPDFEGYVYLTAVANNGSTGQILKSKWLGTAVQDYSAPTGQAINGFTVTGPDGAGYVTLAVTTAPISGIGEKQFDEASTTPLVFALNPISPNPTFGSVHIAYSIPKPTNVSLIIYDCIGRVVKELVSGNQGPARYNLLWQATDDQGHKVGTGVYFVKLKAGDYKAVKKMILVR